MYRVVVEVVVGMLLLVIMTAMEREWAVTASNYRHLLVVHFASSFFTLPLVIHGRMMGIVDSNHSSSLSSGRRKQMYRQL
mmetsp:Transcript_36950/g.60500  ORF Transcript_36950/g.60500 Transcript_36950/m.60500 type:complete len:80 (-) Transcript_36950:42-281(-)